MKKWDKPEVEVLGVEETKYGAQTITVEDGVYVDPETGNKYYGWASGAAEADGQK